MSEEDRFDALTTLAYMRVEAKKEVEMYVKQVEKLDKDIETLLVRPGCNNKVFHEIACSHGMHEATGDSYAKRHGPIGLEYLLPCKHCGVKF